MPARSLVAVAAALALLPPGAARAGDPACATGAIEPGVGVVADAACDSDALGGATPFSYYVPLECEAANPCPVLYLLHGFGGNHRSMTGTADAPSAFVRALTADPVTGEQKTPIPLILVSPHGRTVAPAAPGNPAPDQESFWVDWNPRYWTDPPLFEAFVTEELRGLVERSFPTVAARGWRAILGVSLGGFGSFKLAFQHPDLYASAGSISGALNILVAPDVQPLDPDATGDVRRPPVDGLPFARPPRTLFTPPGFPFGDPFGAFGDTVADEAYYRGNNPLDLAVNASALHLRFFHNDTVTRDPADLTNPASYIGAQILEDVVMPMNLEMVGALRQHGIPHDYELHPGLHSGRYWDPYIREQLEEQYSALGTAAAPDAFDFRSIRTAFSVWGWDVIVTDRDAEEFLTLHNASRDGFTVTGSGKVTIVTPPFAPDAVETSAPVLASEVLPDGRHRIRFDLGDAAPTDEHAGASGVPSAYPTVSVRYVYDD